ncbi:MAG: carboxymuconolactone decarboxylase family protein [Sphingomonadaceae bacterium]|uniref:carboxymuconolactone decarboxylase family protein n=1 Tax=Thermaurantiacus sp. TaxID=2820283 RepID=UPI00298F149D|nr:carboxymuconolactone decarboxylase family protein [Thermaurantiacus sp.]MCS6985854.1 carboxymuconolactone decarboxylase family protein [Sphingomonadaceae bacterium]MDW8413877.1 carboxymuconolactone decarboxylase family protein [Thermaurantiacus sp.]
MAIAELAQSLPDYARDIRLNLSSLLNETLLTDQQKWGTLLACAHATGVRPLVEAAEAEARERLSPEAAHAARAAAAVMAMNNVYYRFTHLCSNAEYRTLPARLRMNVLGSPGVEKADFELFCLAVSAINGCGACVDAHERALRQHGLSPPAIQAAVRLAAVVQAVGATLKAMG